MFVIKITTTPNVEALLGSSSIFRSDLEHGVVLALSQIQGFGASREGTAIDWSGSGKLSRPFSNRAAIVCEVSGLPVRPGHTEADAKGKKSAGAAIMSVLSSFVQTHRNSFIEADCEVSFAKPIDWGEDGAASFSLHNEPDPDDED